MVDRGAERFESGGGVWFKAFSEGRGSSLVGYSSAGGAARASVVVSRDSIWNTRTQVDVPTRSHQGFEGTFRVPELLCRTSLPETGGAGYLVGGSRTELSVSLTRYPFPVAVVGGESGSSGERDIASAESPDGRQGEYIRVGCVCGLQRAVIQRQQPQEPRVTSFPRGEGGPAPRTVVGSGWASQKGNVDVIRRQGGIKPQATRGAGGGKTGRSAVSSNKKVSSDPEVLPEARRRKERMRRVAVNVNVRSRSSFGGVSS